MTAQLGEPTMAAIRQAFVAGNAGGLKKAIDIVTEFAIANVDSPAVLAFCVGLAARLLTEMSLAPEIPERLK